jgi:EmrB/QacA subfamily drug resistance transporter
VSVSAPPATASASGRATGAAPPRAAASDWSWLLPLAVLIVGMFMSILDTSIVNVAIPTVQSEFGATTDQVQWITTAYTLALGVVVPLSGWLGDRFSMSRVYLFALLGFAAGSALCGLAWSLNVLVFFRILQAIGGGVLPVVAMAMVYRLVPRERIGTAMGIYGLGLIFAPAIGPTLGGYLVEYVNWRLIFYINVPIGLLGALAAFLVLPDFPGRKGQRFDVPGFLTVSGGLFALLLAFSEGQSWGWTSYAIMLLISGGLLSLATFVVIELEVSQPLLDVRVFRYWPFTNSLLLIAVLSVGLFATVFYIPLFLQEGQGLGAFVTGQTMLPMALIMGILMPVAGRLYDHIGPRWPAAVGLLITAYGTYLLHGIQVDTPRQQIVLWMCIRSVGMGLAMMPIMTGGLAIIPTALVSRASAINNVVQRVSASLGLAVMTAILTAQEAQQLSDRADLVPRFAYGFPQLAAVIARGRLGAVLLYQQTQLQAFAGALGDLFLLTAGLTVVGVLLALMLRSRPAGAPAPAAAAADGRAAAPAAAEAPAGAAGAAARPGDGRELAAVPDAGSGGGQEPGEVPEQSLAAPRDRR